MERWDSYYYSSQEYPSTCVGASHIRPVSGGGSNSSGVFTSACEHGAECWTPSTSQSVDSESESSLLSPPYSPLSNSPVDIDPQVIF